MIVDFHTSFKQHLFRTYCVAGSALGSMGAAELKTKSVPSTNLQTLFHLHKLDSPQGE